MKVRSLWMLLVVLLLVGLMLPTFSSSSLLAQESTPEPTAPGEGEEREEERLNCPEFSGSPADVRISYYMGEGAAFMSSGQYSSAIYSYTCITQQIDNSYIPAYLNRAVAHTARRSYELALEDYSTAIRLNPNSIPAYNNRGIVFAALVEYEEAIADFDRVLELNPDYVLGYNNRGVIYAAQGEYDLAIADFETAIEIAGLDTAVADLSNPERDQNAPFPRYQREYAQAYALLGIVYSQISLENYHNYILLTGGSADPRIQSAAGSLESRFTFELRFDDGTWLLAADIAGE